jgi:outer membrane biosynthesis protein TonB
MKLLLAGFISVLATAAFAQPDNKPANAMDLRSAQADLQRSDGVPAGGCMPIGLTARGDLVFPMQCRELIERERGPIPEEKKQISEPRSQQEPSAKTAPAEKVTPVAVAPAEKVTPVAVAPAEKVTPVAVAPVEVTPAEKDAAAAAGQAQERARKRLARAERRKQQGPPAAAVSDSQTTGSTTQATGSSLRWFSTTR